MELGAEISRKVKKTIKKQLQKLGCYVDNELPEYIMVMIANKRSEDQMIEDLNLFLNDEAEKFVSWLQVVLKRIQKAMELPDVFAHGLGEDVEEELDDRTEMLTKAKKDRRISRSERNEKADLQERGRSEERSRNRSYKTEEDKSRREHPYREREKEGNDRVDREHDHQRRENRSTSATGKVNPLDHNAERNKHRAREKRDKEDNEKKVYININESEEQDGYNGRENKGLRQHKEDSKEHESGKVDGRARHKAEKEIHHNDVQQKVNGLNPEIYNEHMGRDEAEYGAQRRNRHRIKLVTNEGVSDDKEGKIDRDIDFKREIVNNQYEEGEHEDNKNCEKIKVDAVTDESERRARRHSNSQHRSKGRSRSNSRSESKHTPKESRSMNTSPSSKSKSHERVHKHEQSIPKEEERKSKLDRMHNFLAKEEHKTCEDSRRSSHDNSKSSSRDASSNRKDSERRSSPDNHNQRSASQGSYRVNEHGVVDYVTETNKFPVKSVVASKVQVYTDKLAQTATEVVEVEDEKPTEENVEDGVELDYNETNDENEFSDEANSVFVERRVINFDKEKPGLPTITVNFDKETSPKREHTARSSDRAQDRGRERGHAHSSSHQSTSHFRRIYNTNERLTKGHIVSTKKNDGWHNNMQSRSEHDSNNYRKVYHETRQEKGGNHPRRHTHSGNMVIDVEEKSKRYNTSRGRDRRDIHGPRNEVNQRQRGSHRRHTYDDGERERSRQRTKERNKEQREELVRVEMPELSHTSQSDGDLRDLLLGNNRESESSSDEEEALVQRLREKIKAEKHKRLFGTVNLDEEDQPKEEDEMEEMDDALGSKQRESSENQNERMDLTDLPLENVSDLDDDENIEFEHMGLNSVENSEEKETSDNELVHDKEVECEDAEDEDGNDDGIDDCNDEEDEVEDEKEDSHKEHKLVSNIQDDLEEVSDGELELSDGEQVDNESEKKMDEEQDRVVSPDKIDIPVEHPFEVNNCTAEIDDNDNEEKGSCEDVIEEVEEVEEEVEIEVEVSDNDNLDDQYEMSKETNIDDQQHSDVLQVAEEKEDETVSTFEKDESSSDISKMNTPAESSEVSPVNASCFDEDMAEKPVDVKNTDRYDKRSRPRSSRRKRRHETTTTGDGDGSQISPKSRHQERHKHDRHRRHTRHTSSRSQSDEEFEEILRKKDMEKNHGRSKTPEGKKGHRSHSRDDKGDDKGSRHSHSRDDKGDDKGSHRSHSRDDKGDDKGSHRSHSRDDKGDDKGSRHTHSRDDKGDDKGSHRSHSRDDKGDDKGSHRSHSSRDDKGDDTDSALHQELRAAADNQIIAENKLKAQELLKKSLETVQNVNSNYTAANCASSLEPPGPQLINQNFQGKLPVDNLNTITLFPMKPMIPVKPIIIRAPVLRPVCNLPRNIPHPRLVENGKLVPTLLSSPPPPLPIPPMSIPKPEDNFRLPSAPSMLPPVDVPGMNNNVRPPVINNNVNNGHSNPPPCTERRMLPVEPNRIHDNVNMNTDNIMPRVHKQPPVSEGLIPAPSPSPSTAKITERCAFWPECKDASCPYIHPSVMCKMFPNCSYGQHCIYIHPPCMFGDNCPNATCQFMHISSSSFSGYSPQICKYYPNCNKVNCPFKHVDKVTAPAPFPSDASCKKPEWITEKMREVPLVTSNN